LEVFGMGHCLIVIETVRMARVQSFRFIQSLRNSIRRFECGEL
jgi:hypothetical protein